jgi:HEAT repeat protein
MKLHYAPALVLALLTATPAVAADADVQSLVGRLQSPRLSERVDAAKALCEAGAAADRAVPALVAALRDEYFDVRENAAEALRRRGTASVPTLLEALKGDHFYLRHYAARTLARLGPEARAAVSALGQSLSDSAIEVREKSAEAIANIGEPAPVLPQLLKALEDPYGAREHAARALALAGRTAVPGLVKALESGPPHARDSAIQALGRIGPDAAEAMPAMLDALKREFQEAEQKASAIENAGIRESVRGHQVRDSQAIVALGRMGEAGVGAVVEILRSDDPQYQRWGLEITGRLGPAARPALAELVRILKTSPDPSQRARAAGAIGSIGPSADEAVGALAQAMRAPEEVAARHCALALAKVGGRALPSLAEGLKDASPQTRRVAALGLRTMGPDARQALAALRAAANDADPAVRDEVAQAIKAVEAQK